MRNLAVLLMLACTGAHPAVGSSLVASSLAFGIHANDHAHAVTLHPDGDHLDVVLSHGERENHDHAETPRDQGHPADVSESDHVIHVTAVDAASATPRRVVVNPSYAPAIANTLPVALVAVRAPARSLEPRARSADRLKTIVLRI